jgi:MFS family permease
VNLKLKFILFTNSIQVFAATLLIPVFALFIEDIGGGPELAGILFGISFGITALGNILMIHVSDTRLRNVRLFKLGLLIKLGAWILLSYHQSVSVLICAQILLGAATAIGSPSFNAFVSEHLDRRRHISEWAKWDLMQNSVTAASSMLSGFIVANHGFNTLFMIMAVLTAFSLALSLGITKSKSIR